MFKVVFKVKDGSWKVDPSKRYRRELGKQIKGNKTRELVGGSTKLKD